MAQYNGYRTVSHGSYQEWRNATYGNGYNVDYYYGNQCWDFCALLYYQYGRTLYTKSGGGTAADCWNISRAANSKSPFISVTGKKNIKRGDIIVLNASPTSTTGHIAFADEDYNPSHPNTLRLFGQNQGQGIYGGANTVNFNLTYFLGIFRNTKWTTSPSPTPTPTPTDKKTKKDKFPWAVAWRHWPNFKQ